MTLRIALAIDGDAKGAKQAAEDSMRAIAALRDGAKRATDDMSEGFKKVGTASGVMNDGVLSQTSELAKQFGLLAEKVRGVDSTIARLAAGGSAVAQSAAGIAGAVGPIALLTAGVGLATAAAGAFFMLVKRGEDDSKRDLEEHARLMGLLRGSYDAAGQSVALFGQKVSAVVRFQSEMNLIDMRAELSRLSSAAVNRMTTIPERGLSDGTMPHDVSMAIPQIPQVRGEFQAFANAVERLQQGGVTNIIAAREEIARLGDAARGANPELAQLARTVLNDTQKMGDISEATKRQTDALQGKFTGTSQTANEYDRLTKSMQRQAAAQEAEVASIGKSVGEAARLRAEFILLEAAKQAGVDRTKELEQAIDKLAMRFGNAAQKSAELRLASDAAFDRSQLGRDPIEANVAARMRGAVGGNFDMNGATAAALRLNEQLRISKDLTMDFATTFSQTLRAELARGADGFEALKNAGLNALGRLSDKLLDMQLQGLLGKAFSGGGLNLFNLFGAGGATGGTGFQLTGTGGLYDRGGYTGDIDRRSIAGVVHGREYVINADSTAKHFPLLKAINEDRSEGFARGGFVGPPPTNVTMPQTGAPSTGGERGGGLNVSFHIDARGADEAAVARIERTLSRHAAEFEARVKDVVRSRGPNRW